MDERVASLIEEIDDRIARFESSFLDSLDAMAISRKAQIPFYVLCYRETLIRRMTELSRDSLASFRSDNLVSGIVLARAAVETSAALWYLCAKYERCVVDGIVEGFGDLLARLRVGNKIDPTAPQAVHVLDFIRRVDKDCGGFFHQYEVLSEYAHPNWSGTTQLYCRIDHENAIAYFGQNVRGGDSAKGIGITVLSVALMFFERSHDRIAELLPEFTALCERACGSDAK